MSRKVKVTDGPMYDGPTKWVRDQLPDEPYTLAESADVEPGTLLVIENHPHSGRTVYYNPEDGPPSASAE